MGYKTKGGYAARILAALKHFDLTSDKQDNIILTQNAIDLAIKVINFTNNFRSTISFAGLTEDIREDNEMTVSSPNKTIEADSMSMSSTIKAKTSISYPIPLSDGENAAIMFSSLPVKKKDIEAIKKWLEYFSDNLTETK